MIDIFRGICFFRSRDISGFGHTDDPPDAKTDTAGAKFWELVYTPNNTYTRELMLTVGKDLLSIPKGKTKRHANARSLLPPRILKNISQGLKYI